MLLRKFTLLHDQFHGLSPWRHGFTAAWKSGGAAGATHVQISWISAWIPSEVTRTFFFDLPIWDSNSSSFSCRSFSSQREPTVVGSITKILYFQIWQKTLHATHRLKLLERMYEYKMNATKTVRATEGTGCGTDGRTDTRTDGQTETNIFPNNFVVRRVS